MNCIHESRYQCIYINSSSYAIQCQMYHMLTFLTNVTVQLILTFPLKDNVIRILNQKFMLTTLYSMQVN